MNTRLKALLGVYRACLACRQMNTSFHNALLLSCFNFTLDRNRSTQPPPGTGSCSSPPGTKVHAALLQKQEQVHVAPQEQEQYWAHWCELTRIHMSIYTISRTALSSRVWAHQIPHVYMYRNSTELTGVTSPESKSLYVHCTGTSLSSWVWAHQNPRSKIRSTGQN